MGHEWGRCNINNKKLYILGIQLSLLSTTENEFLSGAYVDPSRPVQSSHGHSISHAVDAVTTIYAVHY